MQNEINLTNVRTSDAYLSLIYKSLYNTISNGRSIELEANIHKNPNLRHIFMLPCPVDEQRISLLMLAALHGQDGVVRLMLKTHLGDSSWINKTGKVFDIDGIMVSHVTALWCALDRKHYHVADTLIRINIANPTCGSHHPLLVEAINRRRFDIVYFLVENGYANVNDVITNDRKQYHALMVAALVGDHQIISYLMQRRANVHERYNNIDNAAIHIAIKRNNLRAVELLCLSNSHVRISTTECESFIRTAVQLGHTDIAFFFTTIHDDESILECLELATSNLILNQNHALGDRDEKCVRLLQFAIDRRCTLRRPKTITPGISGYAYAQECQKESELRSIQNDHDRLIVEALLIRERILIPQNNPSLLPPISQRTIHLCRRGAFNQSLDLALHLSHLAEQLGRPYPLDVFVAIFCQMFHLHIPIPLDRYLDVCYAASSSLKEKDNEGTFMKEIVCLVILVGKMLTESTARMTDVDRHSLIQWIRYISRKKALSKEGQNFLHLSITGDMGFVNTSMKILIDRVISFPSVSAVKLFVCHGKRWIDIDAADFSERNTALHMIARHSFSTDIETPRIISELLIHAGAHLDGRNAYGNTPYDMSHNDIIRTLLRSKEDLPRLKCLCARMITDNNLSYNQIWPASAPLSQFLNLHTGSKRKRSDSDTDEMFGDDFPLDFFVDWNHQLFYGDDD